MRGAARSMALRPQHCASVGANIPFSRGRRRIRFLVTCAAAPSRRHSVFFTTTPISSEGGDDSFQNNLPDPATSGTELPPFTYDLENSEQRVIADSYGK